VKARKSSGLPATAGELLADCGVGEAERGRRIPGRERYSIEAELFADRLCKRVLDLSVPRDRRNSPVHWIRVKIVICTVAFQVAAAFSEAPHQLPPFHSEIAISCLSLGTNVFSEASSTIKRYASLIIA
jgi:hypothetical protein